MNELIKKILNCKEYKNRDVLEKFLREVNNEDIVKIKFNNTYGWKEQSYVGKVKEKFGLSSIGVPKGFIIERFLGSEYREYDEIVSYEILKKD